jgi:hypothetical protein
MLATLLAFLLAFGALLMLERVAHRRLQEVALLITGHIDAAIYLYAIPLLPGVALHEFSHAVMARLLGVPVRRMRLLPERQRGGTVRLGSVEVLRSDSLRSSLIGAAPLLTGLLALGLIGWAAFDGTAIAAAVDGGSLRAIADSVLATLRAPDALVWFYFVFAIANSMLPSPSDTQSWPPVLGFVAAASAAAALIGGSGLIEALAPPILLTLRWLAAALAITAFVDVIVIALLWIAARGLERFMRRRVEYK